MKHHAFRKMSIWCVTLSVVFCSVAAWARLRNEVFENYKRPGSQQSGVLVSGNSGSMQYQIPIALPPGPGGFNPDLGLSYNSNAGNGPLGKGWVLPVPHIRRRIGHGGLNYTDGEDFLYSDGFESERLVKLGANILFPGTTEYRLEFEKGHALRFFLATGADSVRSTWIMLDKEEISTYFGESTSAQISDGASGADRRVFQWNVSRRVDFFGNEVRYWYTSQNLSTLETSYLNRISYGSASVNLAYSDGTEAIVRRDGLVDHLAGFPVRTTRYLKSITTSTDDVQARKYVLEYRINDLTDNLLLTSVQQVGREGGVLPATEFAYSGEEVEAIPFLPIPSTGAQNRPATPKVIEDLTDDVVYSVGGPLQTTTGLTEPWFTADFNGDGCSDVLHLVSNTEVRVWLGNTDGAFTVQPAWTSPRTMQGAMHGDFDGSGVYQYLLQFGDFNGDNADDVFIIYDNHVGFIWFAEFDVDGEFANFSAVEMTVPRLALPPYSDEPFSFEMPDDPRSAAGYYVRYKFVVGDYNGDGRDDLLSYYPQCHTGGVVDSYPGRYFILYSTGSGSFEKQELEETFSQTLPYDFGLPLMGNVATPGDCTDPSSEGDGRADYTILPCDVNSDGLTDLVHPRCREILDVLICQGPETAGNNETSFVRHVVQTEDANHWWGSLPSASNDFRLSAGDFNGDGVLDLMHELYPLTDDTELYILFGSNDWRNGRNQYLGGELPVEWTGFGYFQLDEPANALGNQPHTWFQFSDFDGNGRTDIADIIPWDTEYSDVTVRRECFQFAGKGDATFYHTYYMNGPYWLCGCTKPVLSEGCSPGDGCPHAVTPSGEFPGILGGGVLRIADFNGDGMGDFLNLDSATFANYHTALPSTRPDLLVEVRNGGRLDAKVEYAASAGADNARMGMSIPVVRTVNQYDGINELVPIYTSTFRYDNGSFDRVRKEFAGFGVVTETNESAVKAVTEYHQEPALRGRPLGHISFADTGDTMRIHREYWRAVASGPSFFASLDSLVTRTRDLSGAGGDEFVQRVAYAYDLQHFGVTSEHLSGTGMVDGVYYVSGLGEALIRDTSYQLYSKWRWRQTSRTTSGPLTGVSRQTMYFNHPSTGTTILIIDGYGGPQARNTTLWHDSYGNVVESRLNGGPTTKLGYDPSGSVIVSKRIADNYGYSLRDTMVVDRGLGFVTDTWNANGELVHNEPDEFGRSVSTTLFEGTPAAPAVYDAGLSADQEVQYFEAETPRRVVVRDRVSTRGQPDDYSSKTEYYDLNGILLQSSEMAPPDAQGGARYTNVSNVNSPATRTNKVFGPYFYANDLYTSVLAIADSVRMTATLYDELGRLLSVSKRTRSSGVVHTTYGHSANAVEIKNPSLVPVKYIWNAAGRILSATSHNTDWSDWHAALHTHNSAGDVLTSRTGWTYDFDESSWNYDLLGRETSEDGPDLGHNSYLWHSAGLLMRATDPDGETKTNYADDFGRVTQTQYSRSGTTDLRYYDDTNVDNAQGMLTRIEGASYHWDARMYDSRGRCTSDSVSIAGIYPAKAQYSYRPAGEPTELDYPGDGAASYEYFAGTRILRRIDAEVAGASLHVVYSDYVPSGSAQRVDYFNGIETEPFLRLIRDIGYADGRLYRTTAIARPSSAVPDTVMDMLYTYREDGNVEAVRDRVKGKRLGMNGAFVTRYDYDFAGRLTKEFDNGSAAANRQHTYESSHARMKTQKSGARTMTYSYDPVRTHQIATLTVGQSTYPFAYDSRGHVVADVHLEQFTQATSRTMIYDDRGLMSSVTIPGQMGLPDIVENYTYSPDGQMALQTEAAGAVTVRPYPFYELVNEKVMRYVMSGSDIEGYIKTDGALSVASILVRDRRNNVCAVVNGDGSVSARAEYSTWGQITSIVDQDLSQRQLESQYYHFLPRLHHFGPRKYDSSYASFLGADVINANVLDPVAANRYAYARFNPNRFGDPSGNIVDTYWDVTSFSVGAVMLGEDLDQGNYGMAMIDGLGLIVDGAAAVVPFVPGGVSVGLKTLRASSIARKIATWGLPMADASRPVLDSLADVGAKVMDPVGDVAGSVWTGIGGGVGANRAAGLAAEEFLRATYGGVGKTFHTSRGRRVVDNLVGGIAQESKVGLTSLSKRVREQIAKDIELRNTPLSGVIKVEWHFFPSKTGFGPTGPLRAALGEAGIDVILH